MGRTGQTLGRGVTWRGVLRGCPSRGVVTPGSLSSAVRVKRFTQTSELQFVLNQLNHIHLRGTEITFKKSYLKLSFLMLARVK